MTDGSVTQIRVTEVAPLVEAGALLIDVREHQETAAGKAPEVTCMPLQSFDVAELPSDVPLVLICRSGARSDAAAQALARMGFITYNVVGGMGAWAAAGLPVVAEDGTPGVIR